MSTRIACILQSHFEIYFCFTKCDSVFAVVRIMYKMFSDSIVIRELIVNKWQSLVVIDAIFSIEKKNLEKYFFSYNTGFHVQIKSPKMQTHNLQFVYNIYVSINTNKSTIKNDHDIVRRVTKFLNIFAFFISNKIKLKKKNLAQYLFKNII